MIGQTLAHFRITGKLGEGGMGEVYRAEDTKLGREVAIKVLPQMFVDDPERLARFEREAQLLASLNHPHIAAIHGLDEDDGHRFLVLELVEGETLQEVMARGALGIDESLTIAAQVAEALEAAHDKGVVHRDLKPANIKVTPEGKVKVLDFGLAKAWAPEEAASSSGLSMSPTLTAQMTQAGVILGTASYMSPEQARGLPVDTRADIWAFGVILYEMVTGADAFRGETVTDLIAAVVTQDPDPGRLPFDLPEQIGSLLDRCLVKDPQQRLRDIGDARLEIQAVLDTPVAERRKAAAATPARSRLPLLAALGVGAVLGALAIWWVAPPVTPDPVQPVRFEFELPARLDLSGIPNKPVVVSPDGRRILLSLAGPTAPSLYIRELGDFALRELPGTEGGRTPFFSPDGKSIGFVSGRQIKRLPLDGGRQVTVGEVDGMIAGVAWSEDGSLVFGLDFTRLYRVPATGGVPEEIPVPSGADLGVSWPQSLPGSEWVLADLSGTIDGREGRHVGAVSLASGEVRWITQGSGAVYTASGHLVWLKEGGTHAAAFDLGRLELAGPTAVLAEQTLSMDNYGAPPLAVSENGTAVYVPVSIAGSTLLWVDRSGRLESIGEVDAEVGAPRLSPDGRHLAMTTGNLAIRILDLERGADQSIPNYEQGRQSYIEWLPDGEQLAFASNRSGAWDIFARAADGSGSDEVLVESDLSEVPNSFSPDGGTMLYHRVTADQGRDIWVLSLGGEPEALLATPANERAAEFSPNGRYFAYVSDQGGRNDVYVRAYPDTGAVWKISPDGGTEPVWARHGGELFYRNGEDFLSVRIDPEFEEAPQAPEVLFSGDYVSDPFGMPAYQVSADDQRLLVIRQDSLSFTRVHVILNWFEELRRLAPRS